MKHRILAWVVAVALTVALLPGAALAEEPESWEHTEHDGSWTELTETSPGSGMVSAPTVDGNYYFPECALSSVEWTIEADITLCLGDNDFLEVMGDLTIAEGASLTICTCGGAGALWPIEDLDYSGYSKIINNGTLTIASGTIDSSFVEGEPCIVNNGTLNLVGGTATAASGQAAIQNNAGATLNMSGAPSINVDVTAPSIVSAGTISATGYTGGNVKIHYTGDEGGLVVTGTSEDNASKFINVITGDTFATDSNGNLIAGEPVTYGSLLVAGQQVVDGAKYTVTAGFDNNQYQPAYTVTLTPIDDETSTEYDFMWDEATHTLTLNSAAIKATAVSYGSGEGAGQYALFTLNCGEETGLNINLIGESTLTAVNSNVSSISSYPVRVIENLNGDITFTGSGSLTAQVVTDDYNKYTTEPSFATEYMTAIYATGNVSNATTLTVKGYEDGKDCGTMTGVECNSFTNDGTFTADIQDSANAQAIIAASSFQNTGTVTIDIDGEVVSNNEKNDGGANGIGCVASFTNIGTIDIDISADAHAYGIYGTGEWLNEDDATIDISINTGDSPTPVGGLTIGGGGWSGPLAGISWKNDDAANTLSIINHGTLLVSAESVKLATTVYPDWPTWQYCNTMGILISEGSFSSGSIENTGTMKLSARNGYTAGVYVSGVDGDFHFESSGDLTIEATTMGGKNARAVGIFEQIQIDNGQKIELPLIVNDGSVSITALPVNGYENDVMEGGCMAICLSQAFTTDPTVSVDDLQQIGLSGMSESSGNTALVLGPYEVGIFKAAYINTLGAGDTPATSVTIQPYTEPEPDPSQPSGGSSSSSTRYPVTVEDSAHGRVESNRTRAERGETVTLTVTPDAGYELDELVVTDSSGESVEVRDRGNGRYTFTMPRGRVTVEAIFLAVEPERLPFADVPEGYWAYDAIRYVYENGLMNGTSGTTFSPEATITRGQIVTILWRLEGSPVVNYLMTFDDVAESAYYAEAVRWAASEGIVTGYGDGTFGPGDAITRQQLAAILYRYAQYKGYDTTQGGMAIREYADYDQISGYALEAMDWAVNAGLINGTSGSTLSPQGSATRAQAAVILMRFCESIVK